MSWEGDAANDPILGPSHLAHKNPIAANHLIPDLAGPAYEDE
jgi:hypothetical protein